MMKDHANAMRARDKARARQMIKKNDPAAALSCLDLGLQLTAHLGHVFSDSTMSAGLSHGLICGLGSFVLGLPATTLSGHLNDITVPVMSNWMGSFSGLLNTFLGSTFITDLQGSWNTLVGSWPAKICTPQISIPSISLSSILGSLVPGDILRCLPTLPSLGGEVLLSAQCPVTLPSLPSINVCNRLQKLWNNSVHLGGSGLSIQGGGSKKGAPYTSFADLANAQGSGIWNSLGQQFQTQWTNDQGIFSKAYNNLNNQLKAPGNMKTWKAVPTSLTNQKDVKCIIKLINDLPC